MRLEPSSPDQPAAVPRTPADLYAEGVTPGQVRGPRWQRVGPARYLPASVDSTHVGQRIVSASARLPVGTAIGGWGAAWMLGVEQCDGLDTDGRTELDVALVVGPARQIRPFSGHAMWYDRLPAEDVVFVGEVPVTTAPRTCFDGMRRARDLVEAVVFADQMLHAELVTLAEMREYVAAHPGWRGVPQARRALGLADPMALNAWETRLRMVWVLDAGLPKPLCNRPVFDLYGCLLGYPDILDPDAATVGEFDGAGHRELDEHTGDNAREERFEDHGLVVTRATSVDIGRRQALAQRMQRAHARGLARDRCGDQWTLEIPPDWGPAGAEDELNELLDAMDERWTPPW